jgi:processive 1,2-diacylglycerol beta-glucosyltransferase
VDGLKAVGKMYDKTAVQGYYFLVKKTPKVYGGMYKITDRKNLAYKAVMQLNSSMATKLLAEIDKHNPDVIIMCHAFVTAMVSKLKARGEIHCKTIALITDYEAHRTYVAPNIDAYVLAEPQLAKKLIVEFDVPREKIFPLGIPTFDKFTVPGAKEEICKREGLDPNKKTVLLMAGSFGVTAVKSFYEQLAKSATDLQLIVITGKNGKLFEKLHESMEELGAAGRTKLLFFVPNVEDYMHVSDLIVTKPGGLTITESLACHLPMAIYNAFPGQEQDNVNFLLEQKAAVSVDKKNGALQIAELLSDDEKLNEMRENCARLAQPNAAENLYRLAIDLLSGDHKEEE